MDGAEHAGRDGARRRGARKATRGRASGFGPGGDGRYSDRAGRTEGATAARAGPFRSPRSRRRRPVPEAIARARAADPGADSRTNLTRRAAGRRIRARRQMSICGAARRRGPAALRGRTYGCPGIRRASPQHLHSPHPHTPHPPGMVQCGRNGLRAVPRGSVQLSASRF